VKIAFIMDPLEKVKAYKDTTYYIMLAAQQLGHRVYYLDQGDLHVEAGRVWATITPLTVVADDYLPFKPEEPRERPLDDMDTVFIRTDPPFDRTYLYTTLLLDLLAPNTRVINRPEGLRNWNEKLAALFFPEWTPATVISEKAAKILAFLDRQERITLKPIDGHGGRGIVFLEKGGDNTDQLIHLLTHGGRHRIIAQTYVPEAQAGDKRILLCNGEVLGGILRLHPEGKQLNNLDAGGTAHPLTLSERDRAICEAVGPGLRKQGIYFCGLDILGDYLIEINVTSPTGLRELCDFSGRSYHHQIIQNISAFEG
jgi:glutathione synthase